MYNTVSQTLSQARQIVNAINEIQVEINPGNLQRARMCLKEMTDMFGVTITNDGQLDLISDRFGDQIFVGPNGSFEDPEGPWWSCEWEFVGSADTMVEEPHRNVCGGYVSTKRYSFWYQEEFRSSIAFEVKRARDGSDFRINVIISGCNSQDNYWTTGGTGIYRLMGQNVEFDILHFMDPEPIHVNA